MLTALRSQVVCMTFSARTNVESWEE